MSVGWRAKTDFDNFLSVATFCIRITPNNLHFNFKMQNIFEPIFGQLAVMYLIKEASTMGPIITRDNIFLHKIYPFKFLFSTGKCY